MIRSARARRALYVLVIGCAGGGLFAENVDPDNDGSQYGFAENVGWINAEPSGDGGPGVQVGDSVLTGWMWGENIGWISMSCQNTLSCGAVGFGVANDGDGVLSGYAWGENAGWISFSCANTASCGTAAYRVVIDHFSGEFSGRVWSENAGWISFASTGPNPFRIKPGWTCTDGDTDGSCVINDCDDASGQVYPGAPQVCDGINNDCLHPSWPSIGGTNDGDDDGDSFTECAGDCDDTSPATYPGAPEINDGVDNQCPGDTGAGVVDEISGTSGFTTAGNNEEICWPAQTGATLYEIARSPSADFSVVCVTFTTTSTCLTDPDVPPSGSSFHYRMRALTPNTGSWGQDSTGAERFFVCGIESSCDDGIDNDADGLADCDDPDCASDAVCQPVILPVGNPRADDQPDLHLKSLFNSGPVATIDAIRLRCSLTTQRLAIRIGPSRLAARGF